MLKKWQEDPPRGVQRSIGIWGLNGGAVLVQFAEYRGPSPCYGWFYDDEGQKMVVSRKGQKGKAKPKHKPCQHTWESSRVFVDLDEKTGALE